MGSDETEEFENEICERIRAYAMSFPEADEGSSCVNRAFSAGGKNFAFLGEKPGECGLRLKLGESIESAQARSADAAGTIEVGKAGWAMLKFSPDDPPPMTEIEAWIAESFLLLAPKKIAALYEG